MTLAALGASLLFAALVAPAPPPADPDAAAAVNAAPSAAVRAAPAASEGLGAVPDLTPSFPGRPPGRGLEGGLLHGREMLGASLGLMAGDLVVVGLSVGEYVMFTRGVVSPTVQNFRVAGYSLVAATLLLPPLGATLGGLLFQRGPSSGAAWKAFLLALAGHTAALAVAYMSAPQYWAVVPVQMALMAPGTSLGLNWGPVHRGLRGDHAVPAAGPPPATPDKQASLLAPGAFALGPTCPVLPAG